MASHESKIPSILLPKQLNSKVAWSVFNVQFNRFYNTLYKWLEHHKEDVANSPEWSVNDFSALLTTMNNSGIYTGTVTNIIEVLEQTHTLNVTQNTKITALEDELALLEARVAALESVTP